jgi:lysine-specific demethylase/histidyl-hydroxylase NO66
MVVGDHLEATGSVDASPAGRPLPQPEAGDPRPTLRRCIGIPTNEFAGRVWATAPLLTSGAADFADVFSGEAVDELISARGLRTPFLRMAKNGSVLATSTFTRSGGVGAGIADQVADDKVLAQLAGGATLVLQALHRTWPPLIRFGGDLARELGHPVQINAYITPPENQGFAAHYDTHDVFVLQIAGSKRWTIHRPVIDDPLPTQSWEQRKAEVAARATETPLIDTVLRPGDALYLPRGFLHSAVAQGEVSIHLTVGVHPVTAYDLAKELMVAAAADRELRRSLPIGVDVTDLAAMRSHVEAAAKRLSIAVAEAGPADVDGVASRGGRQQAGGTRPAPLGPLAQLAALRGLGPTTTLRLRGGLRPVLRRTGDRLTLDVIDSTISWPAQVYDALLVAVSEAAFRPVDLPGLDADEQLVVARRLLREGVVIPADRSPDVGRSQGD